MIRAENITVGSQFSYSNAFGDVQMQLSYNVKQFALILATGATHYM